MSHTEYKPSSLRSAYKCKKNNLNHSSQFINNNVHVLLLFSVLTLVIWYAVYLFHWYKTVYTIWPPITFWRSWNLIYSLSLLISSLLFWLTSLCVKGKSFSVSEYLSIFSKRYNTILTCSLKKQTRKCLTIWLEFTNQRWFFL